MKGTPCFHTWSWNSLFL